MCGGRVCVGKVWWEEVETGRVCVGRSTLSIN